MMDPWTFPCDCYVCVGPEYAYSDDGFRYTLNNLLKHTMFKECDTCGHEKTEHLDLGRKGYYTCWWCDDRAAGSDPVAVQ